jgi:hypothetical protein
MARDFEQGPLMQTISRRTVILGGASAATLTVVFPRLAAAQATITVDQFRAGSAMLTGVNLTDLNAAAASKLLDGFVSMGGGPDLANLAADPAITSGALADDIVAAWYSGNFATGAGLASIGLTNALLWDALDFTKPTW